METVPSIIHMGITGVGNDTLWTTKVNPSRNAGADGAVVAMYRAFFGG